MLLSLIYDTLYLGNLFIYGEDRKLYVLECLI